MNSRFDVAIVAECYGVPINDLGIALIPYQIDGNDYEGVLVFNRRMTKAVPSVIAVPNFMGVRQQALEIAARMVGCEYAVFVADVYGKSIDHSDRVVLRDEVVETLRQQGDLSSVLSLDESLHVNPLDELPQLSRVA